MPAHDSPEKVTWRRKQAELLRAAMDRLERGMGARRLEELSGVSASTISDVLHAKRRLSSPAAVKIAGALQIPVDMLTPGGEQLASVDVYGTVRAGDGGTPLPEIVRRLVLSKDFTGGHETFAMRVDGESMIMARIYPGDTVILRRSPIAPSGSIVQASLANDEVTLKRLVVERGDRFLVAENPAPPWRGWRHRLGEQEAINGVAIYLFRPLEF